MTKSRRAYHFQLPESYYNLAMLLDAQRWTAMEPFFPSWPKGTGYYPFGVRTELIRFLKQLSRPGSPYDTRDLDRPRWWPWSERRRPTWEVVAYGIRYRFEQYMTSEMAERMIHTHHAAAGLRREWCRYCHPQRFVRASEVIRSLRATLQFILDRAGRGKR